MKRKTISKLKNVGQKIFSGPPEDLIPAKFNNHSLLRNEERSRIRVFATTVLRGSANHELTGYLIEVDWLTGQIIKKLSIPVNTNHTFWNARGGNRGGRGVVVFNGTLYVAAAMSILKYDTGLNLIGEISHPHMAGIHEIYIEHTGIWITSTVHDLIMKISFDGELLYEWWGSDSKDLQKRFGFNRRELNLSLEFEGDDFAQQYDQYCNEEIFHLNTVCVQDEQVYVFSSFKNALIRIEPKPEKVILQDLSLGRPHNGILLPDKRVIVNDTKNQALRIYETSQGDRIKTISTPIFSNGLVGSSQFARAGWQRGLALVRDSIYLVGTSPATIFEVDIDKNIIGQICQLDDDVRHCIHGLTLTKEF